MGALSGKKIIGLTGNIATGKSVVRRMLEHLGAYGIDADALGHRAIAKGAPGYQPVVDTFGHWILGRDGQIQRAKLARIVFSDPEALIQLEAIVHPLVRQAVNLLARRSKQQVIVLEAIKLLESPLRENCDTIWVTYSPHEIQLARLMQKRGMGEAAARQRIRSQSPQEEKIAAAQVVIRNDGSFDSTWQQVTTAYHRLFPSVEAQPKPGKARGGFLVQRAKPAQATEIAAFISQMSGGALMLSREDVMAAFGEKAYMLLRQDGKLVGLAGWQVENLVARTDEVFIDPHLPFKQAIQALTAEIEKASRELQCEISLLFIPQKMGQQQHIWVDLGYDLRSVDGLKIRAWKEAALESMPEGSLLLFKQLRKDRVLRPV